MGARGPARHAIAALKAVIEFKEQELETLRAQAKKSDAATSVEH